MLVTTPLFTLAITSWPRPFAALRQRSHSLPSLFTAAAAAATIAASSPALALDVDAAFATAKAGAQCASTSCIATTFADLRTQLDTAGLPRNGAGSAAEHTPLVALEPIYGAKKELFERGFAQVRR
jgi:hypothetical protein